MPELPEVETVRTIIHPVVAGASITGVNVNPAFPGVLESDDGIDALASLPGRQFLDVRRRGKYLLFKLDGDLWIIIHLRMTGRLLIVERAAEPIRFQHLSLELDNGMDLRFGDQRKFGRVSLVTQETVDALDHRLGVEPLDPTFTARWLHSKLASRPGKVKAVLLDQHLIAGLGNIYVDEALFRSRIHPLTPAKTISIEDCIRLVRAIRHVLRLALSNQGTTFSTFENPYGESGSNANFLQVYGKGRHHGLCPRCRHELAFGVVGGRGTTWCPRCQPAPPEILTSPA